MLLIPAIDIRNGQCVRLRQGEKDQVSVFSDDPLAVAESWAEQGCRRLHLVDLDGAFDGAPVNHALIRRICNALTGIAVQVGGGIRSHESIDALFDAGTSQVVLGTRAIEDEDFLEEACRAAPEKCLLGLDTRHGKLAVRGWTQTLEVELDAYALKVRHLPLAGFVHTDISRDGMMMGVGEGPSASIRLSERSGKRVVVSGGVTNLNDLIQIRELARASTGDILGVISGRALYEKSFSFRDGQAVLASGPR